MGNKHYCWVSKAACIAMIGAVVLGCSDDPANKDEKTIKDAGPDASPDTEDGGIPSTGEEQDTVPVEDTEETARIEAEVDAIMADLTLEEKAAQMSQPQFEDAPTTVLASNCYGSVFNGGEEPFGTQGPDAWEAGLTALQGAAMDGCNIPIMYGIDAVHGNAKVSGSTVFPHNIGLGATRDPDLVERVGRATGRECRAVGIHMTFAPAVSVVRDERWGRTYEGFGETPEINAEMGAAIVNGLQGGGDLSDPGAVAACAKHFVGDGGTTDGVNNGITDIGIPTLETIHLPPYEAMVDLGLASIMPSYHKWKRDDDVDYHMSLDKFSLTDILVTQLGFDGFRLSDYDAVARVNGMDAGYELPTVAESINAGMDMAMIAMDNSDNWEVHDGVGQWMGAIVEGVNSGLIPPERVDDAVRRILRIKVRMDLFNNPYPDPSLMPMVWSPQHQELAREAVQKSLVLLKNDVGALPLDKNAPVVVAGPWANNIGAQAGGWTLSWQGRIDYNTSIVKGETIRFGMEAVAPGNVTWNENGTGLTAGQKTVVVIGEMPYAEGGGDHHTRDQYRPSPTPSLFLSEQRDYDVLTAALDAGADVVLVIISGRPLIFDDPRVLNETSAIVAAWLPGSRGMGVADVLYGDAPFTGKLPHTWPRSIEQLPVNENQQPDEGGYDAAAIDVLYRYGHGLTY